LVRECSSSIRFGYKSGALFGSGTFGVADLPTLKTLAKAAAADLKLFCTLKKMRFHFSCFAEVEWLIGNCYKCVAA
jgi:hypothetical protein